MNGLLIIDKSGGMTSHDVVGKLRKITGENWFRVLSHAKAV